MTQELAQTKGEELLSNVIELGSSEDPITEIVLKRFSKNAEALLDTDVFNGYLVMGILGALQYDPVMMNDNHRKALSNSTLIEDKKIANYNYAVSLHKLGYLEEACVYIEKANKLYEGSDKDTAMDMAIYLLEVGRVADAMDAIENWRKLKPENCEKLDLYFKKVEKFLDSLYEDTKNKMFDITPQIIKELILLLKENDINKVSCDQNIGFDDSGEWLAWEFKLDLPVKNIVDLNFDLADRLADKDLLGSGTVVMFT